MAGRGSLERERSWRKVIREQKASGLSISAFCRERELSPASFFSWRQKLAAGAGEGLPREQRVLELQEEDIPEHLRGRPGRRFLKKVASASSRGLLEEFKHWLDSQLAVLRPKHDLRGAISYMTTRWESLSVNVTRAKLCAANCAAICSTMLFIDPPDGCNHTT